jgi:hypothetical protein
MATKNATRLLEGFARYPPTRFTGGGVHEPSSMA